MDKPIASRQHTWSKPPERFAQFAGRMDGDGLDYDDLQTFIDCDPTKRRRLIAFMKAGAPEHFTTLDRARRIMGRNFVPRELVAECFPNHRYTEADILRLSIVPFAESELSKRKDSFLLLPGLGVTATDVLSGISEQCDPYLQRSIPFWFGSTPVTIQTRWYLLSLGPYIDRQGPKDYVYRNTRQLMGCHVAGMTEVLFTYSMACALRGSEEGISLDNLHCLITERVERRMPRFFELSQQDMRLCLRDVDLLEVNSPSFQENKRIGIWVEHEPSA